ncbi:MAG: efflux transporter outer membrane subunit, partial [Burkholderiaceae bacterium]|nr:efflux transporter outer membrane subunit [Burkholderiaceae bacterium]
MRADLTRIAGAAVVLAALAVLAGCGTQGKVADAPPAMDLPAGWDDTAKGGTTQAWPDSTWWQHFGSDELTRLVKEGQQNNLDIAAAVSRVRQSEIQARIAGAPLVPNVDFEGGLNRQLPLSSGSATTSATGLFNASYEVDFWGKNKASLSAAEAALRANVYDRETVNLTVTCGIVSNYLQILSLRDRLVVARDNVSNAEQVLNLLLARSRAGSASALDVARQRSVIADQQALIPDLQEQERDALTVLAVLLGHTPQNFTVKENGLAVIQMPEIAPGMPSELLSRRPDIRRVEAQLAAANANIEVARASLFPSITLTGATGGQSSALVSLFSGPNLLANFGASIVAPIFDNGARKNARDLAVEQKKEMVQVYRGTVMNALSEVEKSLGMIHSSEERYKLKSIEVEQAKYAFDLSKIRYREGAEDLMTVIDTQRSLSDAQNQLGQIKLDRLKATVSLYKSLGGGWQDKPLPPA